MWYCAEVVLTIGMKLMQELNGQPGINFHPNFDNLRKKVEDLT